MAKSEKKIVKKVAPKKKAPKKPVTPSKAAKKKPVAKKAKIQNLEYKLPSIVDISRCDGVFSDIKKEIANFSGGSFTIDGSDVELVTSPGIQIILSAAKSVENAGGNFIVNPSDDMKSVFAEFGVEDELNKWSDVK